jgi:ATPase subunit of ABC transporter with duplicated ATPase domains
VPIVDVSEVAYAHPGGDLLFSGVSLRVRAGQHAAVIGANGAGKTTLLRVVDGELTPEAGTARVDGAAVLMPQSIDAETAPTVRDLLARFSSPHLRQPAERLRRAEQALADDPSEANGVELATAIAEWSEVGGYEQESRWDACTAAVLRQPLADAGGRPVAELSGGERKRLVLESLFASDVDVLLLDEPDNFLDLEGKLWLQHQLRRTPKIVVFISHDRELLARAATAVITIESFGSWTHHGSFATYDEARAARVADMAAVERRWKEEERRLYRHYKLLKERASISDKNAGRAQAAENRWSRFVTAGPPPSPPSAQQVTMRLRGEQSGVRVLRCDQLGIDGLTDPFDLEVRFGDRMAVLGPNGSGKSHFMRLLAGDETVAHTGSFGFGARVTPGLFRQLSVPASFEHHSPLAIVRRLDRSEEEAMRALARYELEGCADRPFETLSGGQRARLQILALELDGCNVLLLDEPTDNLDLASCDALERALATFTGTVLSVTHDRWFVRSFDRYVLFDHDCTVKEVLDRDSVLHLLTGDDDYDFRPSSVIELSS